MSTVIIRVRGSLQLGGSIYILGCFIGVIPVLVEGLHLQDSPTVCTANKVTTSTYCNYKSGHSSRFIHFILSSTKMIMFKSTEFSEFFALMIFVTLAK